MVPGSPDILKYNNWILFSWGGWSIGILLVLLLGGLQESLGIHTGGNFIIGVGMGAGVGLFQWFLLRRFLHHGYEWFLFSIIGFGLGFLLFDISRNFITSTTTLNIFLSTATGAVLSSWMQYHYLLNDYKPKAKNWIYYSVIAWMLALLLTEALFKLLQVFRNEIPRYTSVIFAFLSILLGGLLLGLITGKCILSLFQNRKEEGYPQEPGT